MNWGNLRKGEKNYCLFLHEMGIRIIYMGIIENLNSVVKKAK